MGSAAESLGGTGDDHSPKSVASATPKPSGTPKRTLTPDNIIATVVNVVASGSTLLEAAVKPRIPAVLREKIFLAVTSVNDCRYCKWGHSRLAMAQGVSIEEVNRLLSHEMELPEAENAGEAAAILFAHHYAEQQDQIDPGSIEHLRK